MEPQTNSDSNLTDEAEWHVAPRDGWVPILALFFTWPQHTPSNNLLLCTIYVITLALLWISRSGCSWPLSHSLLHLAIHFPLSFMPYIKPGDPLSHPLSSYSGYTARTKALKQAASASTDFQSPCLTVSEHLSQGWS